MKRTPRKLKTPPPYAQGSPNDSVGEQLIEMRQSLIRNSLFYWKSKGAAQALFANEIKGKVTRYITEQSDSAQDTAHPLLITLYMVGKEAKQAVPCVTIVSDDKKARTDAYNCLLQSKIIKDYPGFALGHSPLDSQSSRMNTTSETICISPAHREDEPECYRLALRSRLDNEWPERMATAGGAISYNGRHMLLTAGHFLKDPPSAVPTNNPKMSQSDDFQIAWPINFDDDSDYTDDNECDDDGDSHLGLVETMSQGNMEESVLSDMLKRDTFSPMSVCELILPVGRDVSICVESIGEARPLLQDDTFDYALLDVLSSDTNFKSDNAIQLEDPSQIEPGPRDATVVVVTPTGGSIRGDLSKQTLTMRCPWSRQFVDVYQAKFSSPIILGDSGSWVRDVETGRLFGHVIAQASITGWVSIMPAKLVFEHALATLRAFEPHQQQSPVFGASEAQGQDSPIPSNYLAVSNLHVESFQSQTSSTFCSASPAGTEDGDPHMLSPPSSIDETDVPKRRLNITNNEEILARIPICASANFRANARFVCRDPSSVSIKPDLQLDKPLSSCMWCQAQTPRTMNQALHHLRRTHVMPYRNRPSDEQLMDWLREVAISEDESIHSKTDWSGEYTKSRSMDVDHEDAFGAQSSGDVLHASLTQDLHCTPQARSCNEGQFTKAKGALKRDFSAMDPGHAHEIPKRRLRPVLENSSSWLEPKHTALSYDAN
ncbi:hypothetical protein V8C35DRAFT_276803 [Trichoderma chlorosporum]